MCTAKKSALIALLSHGDTRLPIDAAQLCRDYGISPKVMPTQMKERYKGVCFTRDQKPYIFVRDDLDLSLTHFICAHELGHILQGHVGNWGFATYDANLPRDKQEETANEFALEMTAPQCLLLALGVTSPDQIASLCGIPDERAQQAFEALKRRKQENPALAPLEMAVVEQFSDFLYEKGVHQNAPTH